MNRPSQNPFVVPWSLLLLLLSAVLCSIPTTSSVSPFPSLLRAEALVHGVRYAHLAQPVHTSQLNIYEWSVIAANGMNVAYGRPALVSSDLMVTGCTDGSFTTHCGYAHSRVFIEIDLGADVSVRRVALWPVGTITGAVLSLLSADRLVLEEYLCRGTEPDTVVLDTEAALEHRWLAPAARVAILQPLSVLTSFWEVTVYATNGTDVSTGKPATGVASAGLAVDGTTATRCADTTPRSALWEVDAEGEFPFDRVVLSPYNTANTHFVLVTDSSSRITHRLLGQGSAAFGLDPAVCRDRRHTGAGCGLLHATVLSSAHNDYTLDRLWITPYVASFPWSMGSWPSVVMGTLTTAGDADIGTDANVHFDDPTTGTTLVKKHYTWGTDRVFGDISVVYKRTIQAQLLATDLVGLYGTRGTALRLWIPDPRGSGVVQALATDPVDLDPKTVTPSRSLLPLRGVRYVRFDKVSPEGTCALVEVAVYNEAGWNAAFGRPVSGGSDGDKAVDGLTSGTPCCGTLTAPFFVEIDLESDIAVTRLTLHTACAGIVLVVQLLSARRAVLSEYLVPSASPATITVTDEPPTSAGPVTSAVFVKPVATPTCYLSEVTGLTAAGTPVASTGVFSVPASFASANAFIDGNTGTAPGGMAAAFVVGINFAGPIDTLTVHSYAASTTKLSAPGQHFLLIGAQGRIVKRTLHRLWISSRTIPVMPTVTCALPGYRHCSVQTITVVSSATEPMAILDVGLRDYFGRCPAGSPAMGSIPSSTTQVSDCGEASGGLFLANAIAAIFLRWPSEIAVTAGGAAGVRWVPGTLIGGEASPYILVANADGDVARIFVPALGTTTAETFWLLDATPTTPQSKTLSVAATRTASARVSTTASRTVSTSTSGTATATASVSQLLSSTATAPLSRTLTLTLSSLATPTLSLSPSPVLTATATIATSPTSTPSPTRTLDATLTPTTSHTPSPSPTGTHPPTPSSTSTQPRSASKSATMDLGHEVEANVRYVRLSRRIVPDAFVFREIIVEGRDGTNFALHAPATLLDTTGSTAAPPAAMVDGDLGTAAGAAAANNAVELDLGVERSVFCVAVHALHPAMLDGVVVRLISPGRTVLSQYLLAHDVSTVRTRGRGATVSDFRLSRIVLRLTAAETVLVTEVAVADAGGTALRLTLRDRSPPATNGAAGPLIDGSTATLATLNGPLFVELRLPAPTFPSAVTLTFLAPMAQPSLEWLVVDEHGLVTDTVKHFGASPCELIKSYRDKCFDARVDPNCGFHSIAVTSEVVGSMGLQDITVKRPVLTRDLPNALASPPVAVGSTLADGYDGNLGTELALTPAAGVVGTALFTMSTGRLIGDALLHYAANGTALATRPGDHVVEVVRTTGRVARTFVPHMAPLWLSAMEFVSHTTTPSVSLARSPTATPSAVATSSPSATPSASWTAPPSRSRSAPPTPTLLQTPSQSHGPSASYTPSWSSMPSRSRTMSSSPVPSASRTPSWSHGGSTSRTASPSPVLSVSRTPSWSHSHSPLHTPSPSPALSPSRSNTVRSTATPSVLDSPDTGTLAGLRLWQPAVVDSSVDPLCSASPPQPLWLLGGRALLRLAVDPNRTAASLDVTIAGVNASGVDEAYTSVSVSFAVRPVATTAGLPTTAPAATTAVPSCAALPCNASIPVPPALLSTSGSSYLAVWVEATVGSRTVNLTHAPAVALVPVNPVLELAPFPGLRDPRPVMDIVAVAGRAVSGRTAELRAFATGATATVLATAVVVGKTATFRGVHLGALPWADVQLSAVVRPGPADCRGGTFGRGLSQAELEAPTRGVVTVPFPRCRDTTAALTPTTAERGSTTTFVLPRLPRLATAADGPPRCSLESVPGALSFDGCGARCVVSVPAASAEGPGRRLWVTWPGPNSTCGADLALCAATQRLHIAGAVHVLGSIAVSLQLVPPRVQYTVPAAAALSGPSCVDTIVTDGSGNAITITGPANLSAAITTAVSLVGHRHRICSDSSGLGLAVPVRATVAGVVGTGTAAAPAMDLDSALCFPRPMHGTVTLRTASCPAASGAVELTLGPLPRSTGVVRPFLGGVPCSPAAAIAPLLITCPCSAVGGDLTVLIDSGVVANAGPLPASLPPPPVITSVAGCPADVHPSTGHCPAPPSAAAPLFVAGRSLQHFGAASTFSIPATLPPGAPEAGACAPEAAAGLSLKCSGYNATAEAVTAHGVAVRVTAPGVAVESGQARVHFAAPGSVWCGAGRFSTLCAECPTHVCGVPCSGHGTCDDSAEGSGACTCAADSVAGYWAGSDCSTCAAGFFGAACTVACPGAVDGTACGGHGACLGSRYSPGQCTCDDGFAASNATGQCTECVPGFYGPHCVVCLGSDNGTPCSGHGTCDDGTTGSGHCTCTAGHSGAACDRPCLAGLCGHGSCTAVGCVCDAGWAVNASTGRCAVCAPSRFGASCDASCPDCGAHGRCDDGMAGTGRCVCHASPSQGFWAGTLCDSCRAEYRSPSCDVQCPMAGGRPCSGQGVCFNGTCTSCGVDSSADRCGAACELSGAVCSDPNCDSSTLCSGHGRCLLGARCRCDDGWAPPRCDQRVLCTPPCVGAAVCVPDQAQTTVTAVVGECRCPSGHWGPACDRPCPGYSTAAGVCSGRGRCSVFDGTCGCGAAYRGLACELRCPETLGAVCGGHGTCDSSAVCKCEASFTGAACDACVAGRHGAACSSRCVHGTTLGMDCVCAQGYATPSCDAACPGMDVGAVCGGHGACSDGSGGSGRCRCAESWFGSGCGTLCTAALCHSAGLQHAECEAGTGKCVCIDNERSHFAGAHCDECAVGFWGSSCGIPCRCSGHGTCGRYDGACGCFRDGRRGHWAATDCSVCAAGYIGLECRAQAAPLTSNPARSSSWPLGPQPPAGAIVGAAPWPRFESSLPGGGVSIVFGAGPWLFVATQPNATAPPTIATSVDASTMCPPSLRIVSIGRSTVPDAVRLTCTDGVHHILPVPGLSAGTFATSPVTAEARSVRPLAAAAEERLYDSTTFVTVVIRRSDAADVVELFRPGQVAPEVVLSVTRTSATDGVRFASTDAGWLALGGSDGVKGEVAAALSLAQQNSTLYHLRPDDEALAATCGAAQCSFLRCGVDPSGTGAAAAGSVVGLHCIAAHGKDDVAAITSAWFDPSGVLVQAAASPAVRFRSAAGRAVPSIVFDTTGGLGVAAVVLGSGLPVALVKWRLEDAALSDVAELGRAGTVPETVAVMWVDGPRRELWAVIVAPGARTRMLSVNLFSVSSVAPAVIDAAATATLTITGDGFGALPLGCSAEGGTPVPATAVSPTTLHCGLKELAAVHGACALTAVDLVALDARGAATSAGALSGVAAAGTVVLPSAELNSAVVRAANVTSTAAPLAPVPGGSPFGSVGSGEWRLTITGASFHPAAAVRARCRLLDDIGTLSIGTTESVSQREVVCLFGPVPRPTGRGGRVAYSHDGSFFGPHPAPFAVVGSAATLLITSPAPGTTVEANAVSPLPPIVAAVGDSVGNALHGFAGLSYSVLLHTTSSMEALATAVTSVTTGTATIHSAVLQRPAAGAFIVVAESPGRGWRAALTLSIVPGRAAALKLSVSATTWLYGAVSPQVLRPWPAVHCVDGAGNRVTDAASLPVSVSLAFETVREPGPGMTHSAAADNITDTRLELRRGVGYTFGAISVLGAHGHLYSLRFSASGEAVAPLVVAVPVAPCGDNMLAVVGTTRCQACPENAVCDGTVTARPQAGYWAGGTTSLVFYQCRDGGAACPHDAECAAGFTGPLCSVCADGYGDATDKCNKCPGATLSWVAVAVIGLFCVVALFVFVELSVRSGRVALIAQVRIAMTYLQLLSGAVLSAEELPDAAAEALEAIGTVVSLDITTVLFGCTFATSYYRLYVVFAVFIPFFVLFFAAVTGAILAIRRRLHRTAVTDRKGTAPTLFDCEPREKSLMMQSHSALSASSLPPMHAPVTLLTPVIPPIAIRTPPLHHHVVPGADVPTLVVDAFSEWTPQASARQAPLSLLPSPAATPLLGPSDLTATNLSLVSTTSEQAGQSASFGRTLPRPRRLSGGSQQSRLSAVSKASQQLRVPDASRRGLDGSRRVDKKRSKSTVLNAQQDTHDDMTDPPRVVLVRWLERCVAAFFVVSFVLYPTVMKYSGRLLVCEDINYGPVLGQRSLLKVDRAVDCNGRWYSMFFAIAIAMLTAFGIGLPALALGLIRLFSRYSSDPERTARMFQFVVGGYEPHLWFWEGVMLARKAAIAFANFGISDPSLRSYVMMWTVTAGFALDVSFRPFRHPGQQLVDVLCMAAVAASINLVQLFPLMAADSPWVWIVMLLILGINAATLVILVATVAGTAKQVLVERGLWPDAIEQFVVFIRRRRAAAGAHRLQDERDELKAAVVRTHPRSALVRDAVAQRLATATSTDAGDQAAVAALGRLVDSYEPLLNVTPLLFACPVYTADHMHDDEPAMQQLARAVDSSDLPAKEALAYAAAIFAYEYDIMTVVRGDTGVQRAMTLYTLRRAQTHIFAETDSLPPLAIPDAFAESTESSMSASSSHLPVRAFAVPSMTADATGPLPVPPTAGYGSPLNPHEMDRTRSSRKSTTPTAEKHTTARTRTPLTAGDITLDIPLDDTPHSPDDTHSGDAAFSSRAAATP